MARSPSPRVRRGRSRSPAYRRRSPRRSPTYERSRGRSPGRPNGDRRQGWDDPRRRGGGRPQEDDVSDDDIRGENYQDYRRLKRIKLMERNVRCIWRNTPSPPPEERARLIKEAHDRLLRGEAEQRQKEADAATRAAEPAAAADGAAAGAPAEDGAVAAAEPVDEDPVEQDISRREVALFQSWLAEQQQRAAEEAAARARQEEEDRLAGPELPPSAPGVQADYGTHLRPGEGDAMAAYVQAGKRIPRRGEVGLTADQIEKYESAGYVMSGSRHSRMNAVRIRKENQVYTAEEKAALAMFNFEENKRKEAKVLEDLQRLVHSTLGTGGEGEGEAGPPLPPA